MSFDDFELQTDIENADISAFDQMSERELEEFNVCDDCGGNNHTWETCPDTKDIVYDDDLYTCDVCELDMSVCDCSERLVDKLGLDKVYDMALEDVYDDIPDWRGE